MSSVTRAAHTKLSAAELLQHRSGMQCNRGNPPCQRTCASPTLVSLLTPLPCIPAVVLFVCRAAVQMKEAVDRMGA